MKLVIMELFDRNNYYLMNYKRKSMKRLKQVNKNNNTKEKQIKSRKTEFGNEYFIYLRILFI